MAPDPTPTARSLPGGFVWGGVVFTAAILLLQAVVMASVSRGLDRMELRLYQQSDMGGSYRVERTLRRSPMVGSAAVFDPAMTTAVEKGQAAWLETFINEAGLSPQVAATVRRSIAYNMTKIDETLILQEDGALDEEEAQEMMEQRNFHLRYLFDTLLDEEQAAQLYALVRAEMNALQQ